MFGSKEKRQPSADTCNQLLSIANVIEKVPEANHIIELAETKFSRESLFDQYSKLLIVVQKTNSSQEFLFVLKGLYSQMLQQKTGEVCAKSDLSHRAGPIMTWLFCKRLSGHFRRKYQFRGETPELAKLVERAWEMIESPLLCLDESESMAWQSALPLPMQKMVELTRRVFSGRHNPSLKGMLQNCPNQLQPGDFLSSPQVKKENDELETSYKHYIGESAEPDEEKDKKEEKAQAKKEEASEDTLQQLFADAKVQAGDLLARRCVLLWPNPADPAPAALSAAIQAQCMAQLGTRVLCYFDVKNDSLVKCYAGQNRYQRHPVVNAASLEAFFTAANVVMKPGRDFMLIFSGKLRSNEASCHTFGSIWLQDVSASGLTGETLRGKHRQ